MRADKVVVDNDILWLADKRRDDLLKHYKEVLKVGTDPGPERRTKDNGVAAYCKANNCDLLTGDRTAYEYYFDIGVKSIQMERYDWVKGRVDKKIYLIGIVE